MFIQVPFRNSSAVRVMFADPLRGVVQKKKKKGGRIYEYTHVSRSAILNLLTNKDVSLGFWVNSHLLWYASKTKMFGKSYEILNDISELPVY